MTPPHTCGSALKRTLHWQPELPQTSKTVLPLWLWWCGKPSALFGQHVPCPRPLPLALGESEPREQPGCRKRRQLSKKPRGRNLQCWWDLWLTRCLDPAIQSKAAKHTQYWYFWSWPHPTVSAPGRWWGEQQPGSAPHKWGGETESVQVRWRRTCPSQPLLYFEYLLRRHNSKSNTPRHWSAPEQPCYRWRCQCGSSLLLLKQSAAASIAGGPHRGRGWREAEERFWPRRRLWRWNCRVWIQSSTRVKDGGRTQMSWRWSWLTYLFVWRPEELEEEDEKKRDWDKEKQLWKSQCQCEIVDRICYQSQLVFTESRYIFHNQTYKTLNMCPFVLHIPYILTYLPAPLKPN